MEQQERWERLAQLLKHQRIVVLQKRSRRAFALELGIGDKTLDDLEHARRDNYNQATLLSLESWYRLTPVQLREVLGDIYPIHDVYVQHEIATIQSVRTHPDQTIEEIQESVAILTRILDTLRDQVQEWTDQQQGK